LSAQILFGRTPVPTGILGLEFDVVPSETHNRAWTVTDNPVERGAPISDHIDPRPATLTLEGIVTNAPIGVDADQELPGRAERWWLEVEALLAQLTTVTVVTGLQVYPNMAVTNLSTARSTEAAIRVSMQLRQVRIADSRTVSIPADVVGEVEAPGDPAGRTADQATSTVDAGTVQPTPATAAQADRGSILANLGA